MKKEIKSTVKDTQDSHCDCDYSNEKKYDHIIIVYYWLVQMR
jgi:hypothetical protein